MTETQKREPAAGADEQAAREQVDEAAEKQQGTDYYDDFGQEAGAKGRRPLGKADETSGDPNAQAMKDSEEEGEGYRKRGRVAATGAEEPMTDLADQAPDGHAGERGSSGDGGPRG